LPVHADVSEEGIGKIVKVIKLFKSYKEGYADGEQKRDFVYIKDVVDVILFNDEERKDKRNVQRWNRRGKKL